MKRREQKLDNGETIEILEAEGPEDYREMERMYAEGKLQIGDDYMKDGEPQSVRRSSSTKDNPETTPGASPKVKAEEE